MPRTGTEKKSRKLVVVQLRIDPDLYAPLKREAVANERSVPGCIRALLRERYVANSQGDGRQDARERLVNQR